ncbi:hypothetical protein AGLY_004978 [Aphis glycines]|uniref:Uncharacterized protein n=1 Tax=Aphis glycines TaxID=307491 RepID=A0A6G0TWP8_APHGL|nr:hypothetical protein AGLY_004978 [Aphis glycines]
MSSESIILFICIPVSCNQSSMSLLFNYNNFEFIHVQHVFDFMHFQQLCRVTSSPDAEQNLKENYLQSKTSEFFLNVIKESFTVIVTYGVTVEVKLIFKFFLKCRYSYLHFFVHTHIVKTFQCNIWPFDQVKTNETFFNVVTEKWFGIYIYQLLLSIILTICVSKTDSSYKLYIKFTKYFGSALKLYILHAIRTVRYNTSCGVLVNTGSDNSVKSNDEHSNRSIANKWSLTYGNLTTLSTPVVALFRLHSTIAEDSYNQINYKT